MKEMLFGRQILIYLHIIHTKLLLTVGMHYIYRHIIGSFFIEKKATRSIIDVTLKSTVKIKHKIYSNLK